MAKANNDFTATNKAGFPLFLIKSAAERNAVWERNPPKPMPVFGEAKPVASLSERTEQIIEAERAAKAAAKAAKVAAAPSAPVFTVRSNVPMMTRVKYDRIMSELPDEAHRKILRGMYDKALKDNPKGVPILEPEVKAKRKAAAPAPRVFKAAPPPKKPVAEMSKPERLVYMLTRAEGATLAEIGKANDWELHTAGARISGVKAQYLVNKLEEPGRGQVYRAERK